MKELYKENMWENIGKLDEENISKDLFKKIVFYGFNTVVTDREKPSTLEELDHRYDLIRLLIHSVGQLTPIEFMQVFPIKKEYDGEKYGWKDYFYTMNYIKGIGLDKDIKEPLEFLMEYHNIKVTLFVVEFMGAIDDIRRYQGETSMIEEFMSEHGVTPHTMHTDQEGNRFLLKEGKTTKVVEPKKRKPKYLKLVK